MSTYPERCTCDDLISWHDLEMCATRLHYYWKILIFLILKAIKMWSLWDVAWVTGISHKLMCLGKLKATIWHYGHVVAGITPNIYRIKFESEQYELAALKQLFLSC